MKLSKIAEMRLSSLVLHYRTDRETHRAYHAVIQTAEATVPMPVVWSEDYATARGHAITSAGLSLIVLTAFRRAEEQSRSKLVQELKRVLWNVDWQGATDQEIVDVALSSL